MSAALTTAQAVAAGYVECRTCGHRAAAPEDHNAIGALRCLVGAAADRSEWMTPQPRGFELPRVESGVPVFTTPPKAPRAKRGER